MPLPRLALPSVLALLLGACTPTEEQPDPSVEEPAAAAAVPCICGTPEGAIEVCAHDACIGGSRNPDNADCVCGPITIGEDDR
jgi:hypothetical protein